jgi:hypothetical protein
MADDVRIGVFEAANPAAFSIACIVSELFCSLLSLFICSFHLSFLG